MSHSKEVGIVTDSTACLPRKIVDGNSNIKVLPLTISIRNANNELKTYKDGVDLDGATFTEMQERDGNLKVITSAPVGEDFENAYKGLAGKDILSIHIGSGYSRTIQTAKYFSENGYPDVKPFDSKSLSGPLGIMVLTAAKLAESGKNIDEILSDMNGLSDRATLFAVFGNLDYPFKGGRISRTQWLAGKALGVKPIVQIGNNMINLDLMKKVGIHHAVRAIEEIVLNLDPQEICVIEGGDKEYAKIASGIVNNLIEKTGNKIPVSKSRLGIVLDAHSGPEVLGISVISRKKIPEKIIFKSAK
jgi:DegV family protein with EDD domain